MFKPSTSVRKDIVWQPVIYFIALYGLLFGMTSTASVAEHRYKANATLIVNHHDNQQTWLNGGLGRFAYGDDSYDTSLLNEYNFAYLYRPTAAFQLSTHLQAQFSSFDSSARDIGVVELELKFRHDLDFNQQVSLTMGQFFLPTSMENIDAFWDSPYTISYSSLNSWIGEEFRPIGLDAGYKYHFDEGGSVAVAATAFGGNDSMGALLAFRGWSYGRQRTVFGDVLALPPLNSLRDDQAFGGQRDDGTKPFGRDLDGDPGYALRSSLALGDATFKLTWVDNKGDTTLLHREYAWRTEFTLLGAALQVSENFELLGEAMTGSSKMGAGPGVDIDFYSVYAMFSYLSNNYRLSYRYDQFGIDDRDLMDQENHELGRSHTLALMWQENESNLQLGGEALFLSSKRQRILAGTMPYHSLDGDSLSLSLLARYDF